jgi:integrase
MARGYIEKRGENSWRLVYEADRTFDGKRNRRLKTIRAQTRKEAEKALSAFINEIERGHTTDKDNIRFKELVDIWIRDYASEQLAPKTFSEHKKRIENRIMPAIGQLRLKEIDGRVLRQYYGSLREPNSRQDRRKGSLSPRTILHIHRLISAILEKAVKWGYIAQNPAKKIEAPKVARQQIKSYDEDNMSKLISALGTADIKYRLIIFIAISTGLRRGEIMGLDWSDVNLENGEINVTKSSQYLPELGVFTKSPKNEHSVRRVFLSPSVLPLLSKHRAEQDGEREKLGSLWHESGKIFVTWCGDPMHPDTISKWFTNFLKRKGLPPVRFHSLRHASASLAIAMGVNVKTVSSRLGHANISTTMDIYSHALTKPDMEAAQKLDIVFKSKDKPDKD